MAVFLSVCLFTTFVLSAQRALKKGVRSVGSRVINGYEPSLGCWETNPDPLEKEPVLLITEPSLQPHWERILIHTGKECIHNGPSALEAESH